MEKQYNITIGLSESDFADIKEGGIKLHFLPNESTDYNEKITISMKSVEEDSPMSECMNLSVDKAEALL